jgi:hypothetical protein
MVETLHRDAALRIRVVLVAGDVRLAADSADNRAMGLAVVEEDGVRIVEGQPDEAVLARTRDVARVIEACVSAGVHRALLHPTNLPAAFFDLSSGEAGEILQKLQSFGIRFAVVCPPGSVRFSSRFHEALGREFQVFETRRAARDWLARSGE